MGPKCILFLQDKREWPIRMHLSERLHRTETDRLMRHTWEFIGGEGARLDRKH